MRCALTTIAVAVAGIICLFGAESYSQEVDLQVLVYPWLPDAESGAEKLEEEFEAYAAKMGQKIDLDIALVDTYDDGVSQITDYDIAEIDLCMLDALRREGRLPLDDIPNGIVTNDMQWVGPAGRAMSCSWASVVLPHWVCGNFFVHWSNDEELTKAKSFTEILEALDPSPGRARFLFADLWGGGTLGEFYADVLIDRHGPTYARAHLLEISKTPDKLVESKLNQDAVNALRMLSMELDPNHRKTRSALHDITFVYPKAFSNELDSALLGYSERLYFVEREIQEQPWTGRKFPVKANELVVRQFPFGKRSQGTPTWVDAFVIPKGKLLPKKNAIKLFLAFAVSDAGYKTFLEPREWYPRSYLLPALARAYESEFVKTAMPSLAKYRANLDDSFPMIETQLYTGLDKAGEAVQSIFKHEQNK